jgi:hypothetical protein
VGKSFLALGIARAAAAGESFLGWRATRPHDVVYVDGEMAAAEIQRRLALFGPPPPRLRFVLTARNDGPVIDLGNHKSLLRLVRGWGWPDLVVLDNLSSLTGVQAGDGDRWHHLQNFLLVQRHYHKRAVLMVHHANRKGLPRGTGRREDVLDLVMALRRPADWRASDGARFEIHFEKARNLRGAALEPLAARLHDTDEGAQWRWGSAGAETLDRGVALLKAGLGVEAMGELLGVSRASAFRLQRRARALGLLPQRRLVEAAR